MTKYSVELTEHAVLDLENVFNYITYILRAPDTARKQASRISERIIKLNEMPNRFPLYEKEPWKSRNLHFMPVDNYLVFYIIDEHNCLVTIVRILYSGYNIDNEFNV